jgi:hypothetical protein
MELAQEKEATLIERALFLHIDDQEMVVQRNEDYGEESKERNSSSEDSSDRYNKETPRF